MRRRRFAIPGRSGCEIAHKASNDSGTDSLDALYLSISAAEGLHIVVVHECCDVDGDEEKAV